MVTLLALILLCGVGRSLREEIAKTRAVMEEAEFSCPGTATERVERGGEIGWSRYCEDRGKKVGPWQSWSKQRLVIQGKYVDGERQGSWFWFYPDGTVYRVIEYDHGVEISNRVVAEEAASPE